jgi:UDP-N-acetylmuramate dehydrogenase
MPDISHNVDLLPYNTFRIQAKAKYFTTIRSVDDAQQLISTNLFKHEKRFFLGGGSNILLTRDFDGLIIKNEIKGIETLEENNHTITLKAGAGENWHNLVMHCVERNLGGIENLSLIPGTAGAAPMQNIGAYGVEIKEVIHNVDAIDLNSGKIKSFSRDACKFGYRESIFKNEARDQYLITAIEMRLTKDQHHFNTSYGAIQETLKLLQVKELSVKSISDAVIHIRRSKLPDPAVVGNAGSFFKNPSVPLSIFEEIKRHYPNAPGYAGEEGLIKLAAGWLIEQAGWKGKTFNNIGVHPHQALVLVNYGGGEGREIWQLALDIQASVRDKFNITLQPEVNIL